MITYREVGTDALAAYDSIPMLVQVDRIFTVTWTEGGLGGCVFTEQKVEPYVKDLGKWEKIYTLPQRFNLSNWMFFMAYDKEQPVGGAVVASRTQGVHMLDGRDDISVLWDLRVMPSRQRQGVGKRLFDMAADWSRHRGLKQMKIECQNVNVAACRFYHRQGAVLQRIDAQAYACEPEVAQEVQLVWYLDL